jgi:hypothetical protein
MDVALGHEEVVFVLGVNVGNTEFVTVNVNFVLQAGQGNGAVGGRKRPSHHYNSCHTCHNNQYQQQTNQENNYAL